MRTSSTKHAYLWYVNFSLLITYITYTSFLKFSLLLGVMTFLHYFFIPVFTIF